MRSCSAFRRHHIPTSKEPEPQTARGNACRHHAAEPRGTRTAPREGRSGGGDTDRHHSRTGDGQQRPADTTISAPRKTRGGTEFGGGSNPICRRPKRSYSLPGNGRRTPCMSHRHAKAHARARERLAHGASQGRRAGRAGCEAAGSEHGAVARTPHLRGNTRWRRRGAPAAAGRRRSSMPATRGRFVNTIRRRPLRPGQEYSKGGEGHCSRQVANQLSRMCG